MTLTDTDKELIKLWVREGAFEAFEEVIGKHVAGCPHGKVIGNFRAWLVGVIVGATILGGGSGFALARLIP